MKVVLRSASMKPGEPFVMMLGMIWMPLWFAQVSVSLDSVCLNTLHPNKWISVNIIVKQSRGIKLSE